MIILADMPEGWRVGDCYTCQFRCASISGERYPGINPACPLANAKKAVEVKAGQVQLFPCPGATPVYLDKDGVVVTLYAVEAEK